MVVYKTTCRAAARGPHRTRRRGSPSLVYASLLRAHPAYGYLRLGGGKSLLAGEDTPNARRAFADPRVSLSWIATLSLQLT
jgi:hypothetical protein